MRSKGCGTHLVHSRFDLDRLNLWPGCLDKGQALSELLNEAFTLTSLQKRPFCPTIETPKERSRNLVDYCQRFNLHSETLQVLIDHGVRSLAHLGLLERRHLSKLSLDRGSIRQVIQLASRLRNRQPLEPLYSLNWFMKNHKNHNINHGNHKDDKMEWLDLATCGRPVSEPPAKLLKPELGPKVNLRPLQCTFGGVAQIPDQEEQFKPIMKKKVNFTPHYRACRNCQQQFWANSGHWHLCNYCYHPPRYIRRTSHYYSDSAYSSSPSPSDSNSEGIYRPRSPVDVFFCPFYGCHFFSRAVETLERHIINTHPPIPTEPDMVVSNFKRHQNTIEMIVGVDGDKLGLRSDKPQPSGYWLKPAIFNFDGLMFYTILYRCPKRELFHFWLYVMTDRLEAQRYSFELKVKGVKRSNPIEGQAQSVQQGLKAILQDNQIVTFSEDFLQRQQDFKTGKFRMKMRVFRNW